MGRYSSVQAYADNNTGVRKVPYEQAAAASGGEPKAFVQPEKVVNPYGSTAGAGSGDFHVYRHARNRELQRQKNMELSAQEQEAEEKFQKEQAANKQWEEERTAKRRKKRERQKSAKKRKQNLAKAGIAVNDSATCDTNEVIKDEFTYTPGETIAPVEEKKDASQQPCNESVPVPEKPIPNDGSFLEMMKQKLEAQQQQHPENDSTEKRDCQSPGTDTSD